jgi:hypothetical protein
MKNWKFTGLGRYVQYDSGLIYEGIWNKNKLVNSTNSTAQGFEYQMMFDPDYERP